MKYYLVGPGKGTNLVRTDDTDWWFVDDDGAWVKATDVVMVYLREHPRSGALDETEAKAQYLAWFPGGTF